MTVCVNTRHGKLTSVDSDGPSLQSVAKSLSKLRVAILEDTSSKGSKDNSESLMQAEDEFSRILLSDLNRWFGVESTVQSAWVPNSADLIVCLEPSFRLIELVRSQSRAQASQAPQF